VSLSPDQKAPKPDRVSPSITKDRENQEDQADDPKTEKIDRGPERAAQRPSIVAVELNHGRPPPVYLYFSRADDTIAVEPVHGYRQPAAFPVKQREKAGWRIERRRSAATITFASTRPNAFVEPEIRADGRLYLYPRQTVTVRKHRRAKRAAARA
jgi:hypothetical protein